MDNFSLTPARPVSPGRILHSELKARGWTQKEFSKMINLSQKAVSGIVNGRRQIMPETALRFEATLSIPAEFWINLEANYRVHLAYKKGGDKH